MPRKRTISAPIRPFIREWTPEIFWSFTRREGECLLWTRSVRVRYQREYDRAHRIAYRLSRGPIPKGSVVLHSCGIELCVEPKHLRLGTVNDVKHPNRLYSRVTADNFLEYTAPGPSGCIEWQRQRDHLGYGRVRFQSRNALAHRVAYILFRGAIPDGMDILHSCDNRACVNVDHLRPGTHQDNMRDIKDRARRPVKVGPEDVRRMRDLRRAGCTVTMIAGLYGIGVPTASQILSGKTRTDIA